MIREISSSKDCKHQHARIIPRQYVASTPHQRNNLQNTALKGHIQALIQISIRHKALVSQEADPRKDTGNM